MQTVERLEALRKAVDELRRAGNRAPTLALVPTMGALHAGHLALVREARARAGAVVVSIFVNPAQFGPGEDLASYPRQLEADARLLEAEGVALLWAPGVEDMYPEGFATKVSVAGVSEGLDSAFRPGHFDGVATVVAKLFNQVRPDLAVFGEKDWQQLAVIRRMARDLDLLQPRAQAIIGVPTVREADGLAMSSRNHYLAPGERQAAAALPRALRQAARRIEAGEDIAAVLAEAAGALPAAGFAAVDYVALVDAESLTPLDRLGEQPARLLAAARLGGTRLIDNLPVGRRAQARSTARTR